MTRIILSSANLVGGGSSVARRPVNQKSNIEFTAGLRNNFANAQHTAQHDYFSTNCKDCPTVDAHKRRPHYTEWTEKSGDTLYVPKIDFTYSALAEERSSYEITAKLFFLPATSPSSRHAQVKDAVDLVLKELHMPSIDLLIVSFPGMSFDAESGQAEEGQLSNGDPRPESVDSMVETWKALESLHDSGLVGKLGVAEFATERLSQFLQRVRVKPGVNQINVKDCCIVPKPLILFAKQNNVELLTHNDCTNILPQGTTRELLGFGAQGAQVLADDDTQNGVQGDASPQWVIKYTAVVRNRGVIENKGYFGMAEVSDGK